MDKRVDELRDKLFKAVDPNNSYSYDDFVNECGNTHESSFLVENDSVLNGFKMGVDFVNKSDNQDPEYATSGSAGFDLRSNVDLIINPGDFDKVPTGLFFQLPPNFEMQVRPRSGLAAKHGVTVLNTPGTIDSDYRGEIIVILINHGKEPFKIEKGDRIAQAVVAQTVSSFIKLNKVSEISDNTDRSSGGFGSTGIK
jgi:dUTP pyrophosphatase